MPKINARKRRGIVGIEAAVVLIAFVLVAASLAFVALNMGMFATQRTKEVIGKAYESSSRALEVSGSALANMQGSTDSSTNPALQILVPIRLTAGSKPIDAKKFLIVTTVLYADGTAKSYSCNLTDATFIDVTGLDLNDAISTANLANAGSATLIGVSGSIKDGKLDPNDLVYLEVLLPDNVYAYSYITVEIQTPTGNALTVSRTVPATTAAGLINLDMTS
ncbi:MAG: archaellin/type IV pilin N-terminal domain-containing protein [Nitrososphaeria archaeon]